MDLGKLVGLVFRDLKKAFDTVDHNILCKKLELYGVQHRELSWFQSYLSNRKQFCRVVGLRAPCKTTPVEGQPSLIESNEMKRVNGVDSNIEEIEVGVPQGSCLGPHLFLVYINDLPQAVQASTVSMYADDTSLCHQSNDLTQLEVALNSDLKQLTTWLEGNKLSLNVAKTHSMLISTKQKHNILKRQKEVLELNIRNNKLDVVQKTKYLGVQIDSSLDWREQIKVVCTKISRALGFLKHAKSFYQKKVW